MKKYDFEHLPFGLTETPDQLSAFSDVIFNHFAYLAAREGDQLSEIMERLIQASFERNGRIAFGVVSYQLAAELFLNNVPNAIEGEVELLKKENPDEFGDIEFTDELLADIYNRVLDAFCGYICTNECTGQDLADYVYDCYSNSDEKSCNYGAFHGVIVSDIIRFLANLAKCTDCFWGSGDLMMDFTDYRFKEIVDEAIFDASLLDFDVDAE